MDELAREACREPEEDEIPEATPVVTRKVSLAEAVRYGIPPAKAGIMRPDDLTPEDAAFLLEKGISKPMIMHYYGFKSAGALYYRLAKWGLHGGEQKEQEKKETSSGKVEMTVQEALELRARLERCVRDVDELLRLADENGYNLVEDVKELLLGFRTQKEQYVEKIDSALAGIKISL